MEDDEIWGDCGVVVGRAGSRVGGIEVDVFSMTLELVDLVLLRFSI